MIISIYLSALLPSRALSERKSPSHQTMLPTAPAFSTACYRPRERVPLHVCCVLQVLSSATTRYWSHHYCPAGNPSSPLSPAPQTQVDARLGQRPRHTLRVRETGGGWVVQENRGGYPATDWGVGCDGCSTVGSSDAHDFMTMLAEFRIPRQPSVSGKVKYVPIPWHN